jgi:hypothetical protein
MCGTQRIHVFQTDAPYLSATPVRADTSCSSLLFSRKSGAPRARVIEMLSRTTGGAEYLSLQFRNLIPYLHG